MRLNMDTLQNMSANTNTYTTTAAASSSIFESTDSGDKLPTCSRGHLLSKKFSHFGGCCDHRDGVRVCGERWEKGELAEVWECLKCNYWLCMDCYETETEKIREKEKKRKMREMHRGAVRGSSSGGKPTSRKEMACVKPEFCPLTFIATLIKTNQWFKDNDMPINETGWEFPDTIPPEFLQHVSDYSNCYEFIESMEKDGLLRVWVDKDFDKINTRAGACGLEVDTETVAKISDSSTLYSLANLQIDAPHWPSEFDMIKMYDGLEILSLSTKSDKVTMGTDLFNNVWILYYIPEIKDCCVVITYLKNQYNYHALVGAYNDFHSKLAEGELFKEYKNFKGARFLPISKKVTNNCMPIIGTRNSDFTFVGSQVDGVFEVSGKYMLKVHVTSLSVGNLRCCGPKRTNTEGFVDFFDRNYEGTNGYAVYVKGRMVYHTTANKANYKE
jgi:hypothetical protein